MFSTFGYFSQVSIFAAVALVLIKYIVGLIRRTERFYVFPFLLTTAICIFYSSFYYEINLSGVYQGFSLIAALYFIYLAFVYRRTINFQQWFEYLMWGILATAAISVLSMLFESSNISSVVTSLSRIKLLTQNPNSLAIYCSLSLSYFIYAILNKKGNLIKNIILLLFSILFGFSTKSKTFLLVCIFILLYLLVMLIKKYKLGSIKFIIAIAVILTIIGLIFKDVISTTFGRFSIVYYSYTDHWLNNLTTGRYNIWMQYKAEIISTLPKLLFGVGFFNKRLIAIGPHSLPIHLVYRMGLVGVILLIFLFYSYYKSLGSRVRSNSKTFLPIIVLILIGLVESFL
ncbi:MAG: hypothetical protein IJ310_01050 [Clostridia bacterium]|nr:hypothetical protein [Clostridia bacterium]